MTARDRGFLLLTSRLGDPDRRVLTLAQLRELTVHSRRMLPPTEDRELTAMDLARLGCDRLLADRVVRLLAEEERLTYYLQDARLAGCEPITRIDRRYPSALLVGLGPEAPGSLWAKGNLALLQRPMISLVGCRDLNRDNWIFAAEVGRQAALQGYTLVSGNARGADRTAQDACLKQGGTVVSIVADALQDKQAQDRILYLSEDGFDLAFSAQRALQRNRLIHSMGQVVFVAQSRFGKGGTWKGTEENLRRGYRPVCCFADGSAAAAQLESRGAVQVGMEQLADISALCCAEPSMF